MPAVEENIRPGRTIRQKRSRKTYDALIAAGFALLEKEEFDALTISGIAEQAGYSVGAFYSRFKSKDEFFDALVALHLEQRMAERKQLIATEPPETLVGAWVDGLVWHYWKRRRFWRAVLLRSTNDPDFWAPIHESARLFIAKLTARIQNDAGRELTPEEVMNVHFAIHLVLGAVNNRIVNRPQASLNDRKTFIRNLTRAFLLVSDYDKLVR